MFSSVAQSCLTLCDPMDCSMLGFRVLHQLPELALTPVHQVSDAIQPPYPLLSPSLPAFNLSHHQCLFQWINSLHQVANIGASALASVLPMNIQGWFPLGLTSVIFLLSSPAPQFKSINSSTQPSLWSNSHIHTWLPEKPMLWQYDHLSAKSCLKLSRFVIAFLPRSKSLLILWLQSLVTVILEPKNMKPDTASTFPPSICHEAYSKAETLLCQQRST